MRDFECRVWDKEDKKMIYDAQNTYDYGADGCPVQEFSFGDLLKNDRYIVMWYTGVKDKNGKKIFQSDVVKDYFGHYETIEFGQSNCDCCNGVYGFYTDGDCMRRPENYEVVGNIYENSNLLNK